MSISDVAKAQIVVYVEELMGDQTLTSTNLLSRIAKKFEFPPARIRGELRDQRTSAARAIAAYVYRQKFGFSVIEAGARLSVDHSSIVVATKRIEAYRDYIGKEPEKRTRYLTSDEKPLFQIHAQEKVSVPGGANIRMFGSAYGELVGQCILMDEAGNAYLPLGCRTLEGLQRIKNPRAINAVINLEERTITFDFHDNLETRTESLEEKDSP